MIKVGIIGATGYAGAELVRLLQPREDVEIVWYGSRSYIEQPYAAVYKSFFEIVENLCRDDQIEALAEQADVIFTATPQGFCASYLNERILSMVKVIDLSADFRITDPQIYEQWYQMKHPNPALIQQAVYGLPEVNREKIKQTRLVANPGCYPTCTFLSIYPLLKEQVIDPGSLIVDAKSGVSGAGRGANVANLYCEINDSVKAYGVTTHRHTPEIEEQLSVIAGQPVVLNFTPHLIPMNRGILITAYAQLRKDVTQQQVKEIYQTYYREERFVRVLEGAETPQTRSVKGSNFVDVNALLDPRTNRIVMMGAMDNLIKGAAGQAVQNMNLMFGCAEDQGLGAIPMSL